MKYGEEFSKNTCHSVAGEKIFLPLALDISGDLHFPKKSLPNTFGTEMHAWF